MLLRRRHLSFGNKSVEVTRDSRDAAINCGLADIDEDYAEAGSRRDPGDAATHGSGADDPDCADWHGLTPLLGRTNPLSPADRNRRPVPGDGDRKSKRLNSSHT